MVSLDINDVCGQADFIQLHGVKLIDKYKSDAFSMESY